MRRRRWSVLFSNWSKAAQNSTVSRRFESSNEFKSTSAKFTGVYRRLPFPLDFGTVWKYGEIKGNQGI
jgi:hypothetical protein